MVRTAPQGRLSRRVALAVVCAAVLAPLGLPAAPALADRCPWMNSKKSPAQRAQMLLATMTLDEKIAMIHGVKSGPGVGNVAGNPARCVRALALNDGPSGVSNGNEGVTAFPVPIARAASWDPAEWRQFGKAHGWEAWHKGSSVTLAPGVNIGRFPNNGRTFEYFGEDPYFAGTAAVAEIKGRQEDNPKYPVIATVKHFAVNNQETNRVEFLVMPSYSSDVDERTLREIYLPPFEAAVKEGRVGSVMCAHNKVNGVYACENPTLLNGYLKREFGFDGWVMPDWGATHSTAAAANAGLDMEMPASTYFGDALKAAVRDGQVRMSRLDDMVLRILRTMFRIGVFDHPAVRIPGRVSTPAHISLARTLSEDGTVLLRNEGGILPLEGTGQTIAVIGQAAGPMAKDLCSGGGSSKVSCSPVTPKDAIAKRGSLNRDTVVYDDGSSIPAAAVTAAQADVAIVFAYYTEREGTDRWTITLDDNGDALIAAVAAANPNTIVVLNTGGPVMMPWVDQVKAVVESWYPGQEGGSAIARVLFGDVNPSAKLPQTFPKSQTDQPAVPPVPYPNLTGHVSYSEGIFVGYRWYDAQGIEPLFPFGFGLSYTTFRYSGLAVTPTPDGAVARFTITNTGKRAGAEVAQVYLGFPASTNEPPKQLKGYRRVSLGPGKSATVTVPLDERAFAYWDTGRRAWTVAPGTYTVMVGGSSRDVPLRGSVLRTGTRVLGAKQQAKPGPSGRPMPATGVGGPPLVLAAALLVAALAFARSVRRI